MASSVAKNIRSWSLQLSNHGGMSHAISLLKPQNQCRRYSFLNPKLLAKPTNFKACSNYYFRHAYSTSSSSSSSGHKIGFLKWYLGMLETRPFITKGFSSSLLFCAADITSQIISLQSSGSYDILRTLRIAGYGLLIMGPSQHLWFTNLSKVLPGRDVFTTLKKIFMGQAIFGPIICGIFFSYNAALQGETTEDIVARLKRDLLPTLMNGLMYWPLCDFLTFRFIPVHLQPLANSSFAYFWTIYLTYMASLEKVSKD